MLATTVADLTAGLVDGLLDRSTPFEILVVENGSNDGTSELARDLAAANPAVRAMSLGQADYGRALRTGFLAARGEFVAIFDVDYYDLGFLGEALRRIDQPDNPVIVLAAKRGAGADDTRPLPRRLVTATFSTILQIGFGLGVSDTHGMKVLRRAPLVPIAEKCRFGTDLFDTELVLRTERAGLVVAELPVRVEERRPSRTSIVRRIPRTIAGLARLRLALWEEARSH